MLTLRNPHSVLAALKTRPRDVVQVMVPPGAADSPSTDDVWSQVAKLARENRVSVVGGSKKNHPNQAMNSGRGKLSPEGGREGAAEASVREKTGISVEELFSNAKEKADGKGLWIALDSLQDPHNVGAVFRTASFFGVQGILLTQERSAPLSGTAYDVASGGMETLPFTMQTNLQRAFEVAKEAGLWILGTSEHAKQDLFKIERDRPWLLVLGNEEKGLRRLTEETCDVLCGIKPHAGGVTSLNVSVAAGICISHLV